MNLYERWSQGGLREVAALDHIDPFEFSQLAQREFGAEIESGSIKLVYEAVRFDGRNMTAIRCHKTSYGAKPVTIGLLKKDDNENVNFDRNKETR